jgi:acyl carrier protein
MDEFLDLIAGELDGEDRAALAPETRFRELGTWSSMQALLVMARIDEVYGVTLSADDMRQAQTLADLYDLVQRAKAA